MTLGKMDRFPRFRRSKKDAATGATPVHADQPQPQQQQQGLSSDVSTSQPQGATATATTTAIPSSPATSSISPSKMTTTPPESSHRAAAGFGGHSHALEPPEVQSKSKPHLRKLSPFSRGFQSLRSSHKRSRDSPPASLPQSPTDGPASGSRPGTAVAARTSREDKGAGPNTQEGARSPPARRPKMPAFLELGEREISEKFTELAWLERTRLAQSAANPSPSFRWARPGPVAGQQIRHLDRYVNIQPWENNRVRLRVPAGRLDYINASPVSLPPALGRPAAEEQHRYIAMQGPKQATTDHVWRMVVEQLASPGVIVMLTETHEANTEKCYQYFPRRREDPPLEVNGRDEFGDGFYATVRCEGLEDTPAGDAIELRKLVVRVQRNPRRAAAQDGGKKKKKKRAKRRGADNDEGDNEEEEEEEKDGRDGSRRDGRRKAIDEERSTPAPRPTTGSTDASDLLLDKLKSPTADIRHGLSLLPSSLTEFDSFPDSGSITPIDDEAQEDQPSSDNKKSPTASSTPTPTSSTTLDPDGPEERTVYHLLYKKWPDFGVPALHDLDSFFALMRLSRERNADPANPRVVHCSAGVGRSGTFIALEHLVRELEAGTLEDWDARLAERRASQQTTRGGTKKQRKAGETDGETLPDAGGEEDGPAGEEDDVAMEEGGGGGGSPGGAAEMTDDLVFDTVNALREQRKTMVQAESQYLFIYQVLRKLWTDKYGGGGGGGRAEGSAATGREGSGEPAAKRLEVDPFVETGDGGGGFAGVGPAL